MRRERKTCKENRASAVLIEVRSGEVFVLRSPPGVQVIVRDMDVCKEHRALTTWVPARGKDVRGPDIKYGPKHE